MINLRPLIGIVVRCLVLVLLPFALVGCLVDPHQVVGRSGAVDVPGLSGKWSGVGANEKLDVLIARTAAARYAVVFQPKSQSGPDEVYDDVFLVPIPGYEGAYVASVFVPSRSPVQKGGRVVFPVKLRAGMLEWRMESAPELAEAAKRAGLPLNGGIELRPGTQDAVLAFYGKLSTNAFKGSAFRRAGWFSTSATKSMTMGAAEAALVSKKPAEAVPILTSLANRGHRDAQFRLAGMYASGSGAGRDARMAAYLYKSAFMGGHPQAAGTLAQHLTSSGLNGQPGYEEAIWWYAMQSEMPAEYGSSGVTALTAALLADCGKRDKRLNTDEQCAQSMMKFQRLRARIALDSEETANAIVESAIDIEEKQEAARRTQDELDRAIKERQEVQEERAKIIKEREALRGRR